MTRQILITCEHAGNDVPEQYKYLFAGHEGTLSTHLGWDPGAWKVAMKMGELLASPAVGVFVTRLLIEVNRSLDNHQLFSEYSRTLGEKEKENLVQHFYLPHRDKIEKLISGTQGQVVHLSIHSFTPVWNGKERKVDIGLLFDPDRSFEFEFCKAYSQQLKKKLPEKNIVFNEPYKGIEDGFTTYLRSRFSNDRYAGIEIELNQKYLTTDGALTLAAYLVRALPLS